jgi:hypothetical protein
MKLIDMAEPSLQIDTTGRGSASKTAGVYQQSTGDGEMGSTGRRRDGKTGDGEMGSTGRRREGKHGIRREGNHGRRREGREDSVTIYPAGKPFGRKVRNKTRDDKKKSREGTPENDPCSSYNSVPEMKSIKCFQDLGGLQRSFGSRGTIRRQKRRQYQI